MCKDLNSMSRMRAVAESNGKDERECAMKHDRSRKIGGVVDYSSRTGREQGIAIEMAVQDFHHSTCSIHLVLRFKDSQGSSPRAASSGKSF